jgi:hypothetical protein
MPEPPRKECNLRCSSVPCCVTPRPQNARVSTQLEGLSPAPENRGVPGSSPGLATSQCLCLRDTPLPGAGITTRRFRHRQGDQVPEPRGRRTPIPHPGGRTPRIYAECCPRPNLELRRRHSLSRVPPSSSRPRQVGLKSHQRKVAHCPGTLARGAEVRWRAGGGRRGAAEAEGPKSASASGHARGAATLGVSLLGGVAGEAVQKRQGSLPVSMM